ncbi:MAG: hypothetical protein GF317_07235 [Candidatus Lokiarchaeota archaeon]|nr:hypothetical protein [Candidatus Lokiarchaeota archaeon]MBD3199501.1 hypothetical protein [Candidatus Lokiarchaeota archaeon]
MIFVKIVFLTLISFSIALLLIAKNTQQKEKKINKFITLKLENGRTNIYVKNQMFRQCMYLLLNIPVDNIRDYDEIDSIDEAAEYLDRSMERDFGVRNKIKPEVEFWGHCSNIQAWVENGYDTRILHRNIAFPLLKELVRVGDPQARKVFKEEVALRASSGHSSVINFLIQERYLKVLSTDEFESIFSTINLPILNESVRRLNDLLNTDELIQTPAIISIINQILRYFHIKHFPIIFQKIKNSIKEQNKETLVREIYQHYKERKNFPLIRFLNQNIEYFDEDPFDFIKYDGKIIGIAQDTEIHLINQKISNIENIEGLEGKESSIEILDLSNNLLKNLSGIENYDGLICLKLNNNIIENLTGLNANQNLEHLFLRNNRIKDLTDLKDLQKLKSIDLSGNEYLTEIPDNLRTFPSLEKVKMWECNIRDVNDDKIEFLWQNQNYRYFQGFNTADIEFYERTHKSNAKSDYDGKLYKDFVSWVIKLSDIMEEFNFNHNDVKKFELVNNSNIIWSGRPTKTFLKWLKNKNQRKITYYL